MYCLSLLFKISGSNLYKAHLSKFEGLRIYTKIEAKIIELPIFQGERSEIERRG
jgi:hypothetical protein